jgi:tetratricopeptide (TPR) repeat protein
MKKLFSLVAALLVFAGIASSQTAAELVAEGLKLKGDKKPAEAIDKFKAAIVLNPNYYEALYESGWCYNDLKKYAEAISVLRKARQGWSSIPKVHFELGYAFDKTSMIDSAVASYNRCLVLKPDYSLAHKMLGFIEYEKDNYEEALRSFDKYESYTKAAINDYVYWYRKGFMYNAQKKYADAITPLDKSIDLNEDYLNSYLEKGFAYKNLRRNEDAINMYKQAIQVDPASYIPYNGIGEVYRDNIKDMEESMNWYKKALEKKKNERKANFGIGYCLNSLGRYSEAIPYLQSAIDTESTYTAAYVDLGYAYYMTGRFSEAISKLEKAISLSPLNENARYYLGLVYIDQKNRTQAQKMVDELNKISSKHAAGLQAKVDKM